MAKYLSCSGAIIHIHTRFGLFLLTEHRADVVRWVLYLCLLLLYLSTPFFFPNHSGINEDLDAVNALVVYLEGITWDKSKKRKKIG